MLPKPSIRNCSAALILLTITPLAAQTDKVDLSKQIVGAREWTHLDGRKVKAGIEDADSKKVTLRLTNGKAATIEIAKLSEEDRKHVATWVANNAIPEGFGKPDQTVVITCLKGNLKYDKSTFSVYPGKKIKLVIRNIDDMHHNLVICKPSKDKGMAVAEAATKLGVDGFNKHWIPEHKSILFASRMAEPHSTATIYFEAPAKTGKYPYVCTFPGHAQIMNGTMVVTKQVNPLSELTFTLFKGSWDKLPDFDKLEPEGTDHVESGKIDIGVTKEKENFGLVFNGKLTAPADGDYQFTIGSDDGSRLIIGDKVVIDHDGIHGNSNKGGKIKLSKGLHDLELQYFEKSGEESRLSRLETAGRQE